MFLIGQYLAYSKKESNGKSTKMTWCELLIYILLVVIIILTCGLYGGLVGNKIKEHPDNYDFCPTRAILNEQIKLAG